jgi:hypothetical protein
MTKKHKGQEILLIISHDTNVKPPKRQITSHIKINRETPVRSKTIK